MRETVFTEEEAGDKACCNGTSHPANNGPCIASRCMAWEWIMEAQLPTDVENLVDILPRNCVREVKVWRGYCGLSVGDKR